MKNLYDLFIEFINKYMVNIIKNIVDNIEKNGLLNPLTVIFKNGKYDIIAGQRRYNALLKLNYKYVHYNVVSEKLKDVNQIIMSFSENIHRYKYIIRYRSKQKTIC